MIIKNQEEVEILREGGRRLALYMRELIAMVRPGVVAHELEKAALEKIAAGGDTPSFLHYRPDRHSTPYPAALCVSINDAVVHGLAGMTDYVIKEGDVVSLDLGVFHNGLHTDHAATTIAGKAKSATESQLVHAVYEALAAEIAAARVGNTVGDIGYAGEKVARAYGFGFPKILAGHGVGRSVHESPFVPNFGHKGEGERLVEGMVLALEPMLMLGGGGVYLDKDGWTYRTRDGERAAHAENTILITKDGPEILTK